MAEGARLESVYTVKNGIEGSNPSFSAETRIAICFAGLFEYNPIISIYFSCIQSCLWESSKFQVIKYRIYGR